MSFIRIDGIEPELNMLAPQQRYIFGSVSPVPLYQNSIDNLFVPVIGTPSQLNFEFRNSAFSGYRWIHTTTSTDTYGSYKLQRFLTASPTGIDIMTFNNDGTFVIPGLAVNDAKYILQTTNANLPNAQSLGALTTGILKNTVTTGTGVLSTAVAGTDYATLANRLDQFAVPTASLNLNSQKIINLLNPTNAQDAATKSYVDSSSVSIGNATFIIQTADADLPNAQILGSLATGLLKNTTTTGVLTIGVAGTDYYSLNNPTKLIDNAVSQNVSMGRQALQSLTSGTGNAIFGGCGLSITSGTTNSIFGANTGNSITSGSSNSIFGAGSGGALTTGNTNLFMGGGGAQVTTPSFNVFLGSEAGGNLQTGSGRNVGVGVQAGYWGGGGFATYDNCIFIGNQALAGALNLTNAVAIGAGTTVLTSNSMVLGNSLNVGIGLNNPTLAKLIVSGGVTNVASEFSVIRATGNNNATKIEIENQSGSGKLYELRSDDAGAFSIFDRSVTASRMFINASGNIGLNMTSSILAKLHVTGGVTNVGSEESCIRGVSTASATAAKFELQCTNGSGKLYEIQSLNTGSYVIFDRAAIQTRFIINSSGFVGLGTISSPQAQLQLPSVVTNRQIVLHNAGFNDDFRFHGFGSITGGFGYNIIGTADSHVFFAGVNSTTRNEVARISGTGDITAADTFFGRRPSGTCYMAGNLTATTVAVSTATKVAGTTSSVLLNKFTMPANNRLQYTGTPTITAYIVASVNGYHNVVAGDVLSFLLMKNGAGITMQGGDHFVAQNTIVSVPIVAMVSLATNDYIELYTSTVFASSVTVTSFTLSITTT